MNNTNYMDYETIEALHKYLDGYTLASIHHDEKADGNNYTGTMTLQFVPATQELNDYTNSIHLLIECGYTELDDATRDNKCYTTITILHDDEVAYTYKANYTHTTFSYTYFKNSLWFGTLHEINDCYGKESDYTIEVLDTLEHQFTTHTIPDYAIERLPHAKDGATYAVFYRDDEVPATREAHPYTALYFWLRTTQRETGDTVKALLHEDWISPRGIEYATQVKEVHE